MQDNCIAVALGLPELRVLRQKERADRFEIEVIYRREGAVCPRCGRVTKKEHDRRAQRKKDRRLRDKPVFLIVMKRRFRCGWCGKVFSEPSEVFESRRRSTKRFREHLGREGLHQTVKRVAIREGVGEGLVRRCVTEEIGKILEVNGKHETPEYLGMDEFSVKGRRLYHTAICDLANREVMEVVEGHGRMGVEEYLSKLEQPEKVKAVAMDMHEPFRQAVQMCLPQAKIVVDKFHVIRHVNAAMDRVRTRLQGGNRKGKRSDLFRSRYTLLKGAERLSNREMKQLGQLFLIYPELEEAWKLKESFRQWYQSTARSRAAQALQTLIDRISVSSLGEFRQLLSLFDRWGDDILNYFDYRITNGFVEGKNNRIKTLKRMAYGYRNMDNFRLRILATNPSCEVSFSHLLT